MRAQNFCAASIFVALVGCGLGAPIMPDIETKLIDAKHDKVHIYLVPKVPGQSGKFLRSEKLLILPLDKNFCVDPHNYSLLEEYVAAVEEYSKEKCK